MDLLEREQQLSALEQYAADVAHGHGRLVLVSGEAGVGKSSLVEAGQARLSARRSVSDTLDRLIAEARRHSGGQTGTARSVAGTIRIVESDRGLVRADSAIRALFPRPSRGTRVRATPAPRGGRG